jgi:hypothetical protein
MLISHGELDLKGYIVFLMSSQIGIISSLSFSSVKKGRKKQLVQGEKC